MMSDINYAQQQLPVISSPVFKYYISCVKTELFSLISHLLKLKIK